MSISFIGSLFYSQFLCHPSLPQVDCSGKTVIVTGANVGLGKAAAAHFVSLSATKVIIACRSVEKGEAAKTEIIKSSNNAKTAIEVWPLDLSDYESIRSFVKRANSLERLDIVIENAGVMAGKFELVNGHENTIAINVISTFLLALMVLPKLQETAKTFSTVPDLTIVASDMHYLSNLSEQKSDNILREFNTPTDDMVGRYATSKLLEVMIVRELARRNPFNQLGVVVNCLTPGWCHSTLDRNSRSAVVEFVKARIARTTEVGGMTLVDAAVKGPETHGKYLQDCDVRTPSQVVEGRQGPELMRRFWDELIAELEKVEPGVSGPYNAQK
ncbi:NAD(P)-binding protein [Dissoconium aciculare CBS 342.82]|uniref:NAD(P)-binding protein n=1 Tax=Dissoconium aciculare CBS 342.82 TaxID=1314786 RepID=A0A6J3LVH7_9PEZI|nr:NAD(P)-binding protein [Dissoconium aciculare CBS 342.82]KAF1819678.1 NAD(P)-binding protein [Dissoconium aciculare CBS 342.82]